MSQSSGQTGSIGERVKGIWDGDEGVWKRTADPKSIPSRSLGWLRLPYELDDLLKRLIALRDDLYRDGIRRALLLGMGGSSMAAIMFNSVQTGRNESMRIELEIVDTVHPTTVERIASDLDVCKTVFLVASKSGTTVETLMLERFFRGLCIKELKDNAAVAQHFIALSDDGTPLAQRGADREQFRCHITTPQDVGGRFSALTAFGMLPAVLSGFNPQGSVKNLLETVDACRATGPGPYNPGVRLVQALANPALSGTNKVTLVTSPGLGKFSLWAEQLMAESTGKDGKGLVPVTAEGLTSTNLYELSKGRNLVFLRLEDDDNHELDELLAVAKMVDVPYHLRRLQSVEELLGELFVWEFAVALSGMFLEIYPFDQPDVESAKRGARRLLEEGGSGLQPKGITLDDAWRNLEGATNDDYIAVFAWLDETPDLTRELNRLCEKLTQRTGRAVLFGYGPRYLHSTGQLLKGGPKGIDVLVLYSPTVRSEEGAGDTLGELLTAQMIADMEVMRTGGQNVWVTALPDNPARRVEAFLGGLN